MTDKPEARPLLVRLRDAMHWWLTPVVTSVKGELDRNDARPVVAKVILYGAAGASAADQMSKLSHDPAVIALVAGLIVAAFVGFLEAWCRAYATTQTPAPSADPSVVNVVNVNAAPSAPPLPPTPSPGPPGGPPA